MRQLFSVTYERVNDREAMAGGTARHGFLERNLSLADTVRAIHRNMPAASETRGAYASDSDTHCARWYSVESAEWGTGDNVTYSVHFPDNTRPASRARLCRVLACKL